MTKLSPENKLIAGPLANIFGEPMVKRLFSGNWTLRAQAVTGLENELGIDKPSFWKESRKEDIYVGVF